MSDCTMIDIARRLYHRFHERNITPPIVTLTFSSVIEAHRAWHGIIDEFPEWSLNPVNKQYVEEGSCGIHGVAFKIEPMK